MGPLETVLHEVEAVLQHVDDREIEAFAQALLPLPRIFVTGEQSNRPMAETFALQLIHLGFRAFVPSEAVSPGMHRGDGLVAIADSGAATHTTQVVEQGKGMGAMIFVVCAQPQTRLATLADYRLILPAATATTAQAPGALFDQVVHLALDAVALVLARHKQGGSARQPHGGRG